MGWILLQHHHLVVVLLLQTESSPRVQTWTQSDDSVCWIMETLLLQTHWFETVQSFERAAMRAACAHSHMKHSDPVTSVEQACLCKILTGVFLDTNNLCHSSISPRKREELQIQVQAACYGAPVTLNSYKYILFCCWISVFFRKSNHEIKIYDTFNDFIMKSTIRHDIVRYICWSLKRILKICSLN